MIEIFWLTLKKLSLNFSSNPKVASAITKEFRIIGLVCLSIRGGGLLKGLRCQVRVRWRIIVTGKELFRHFRAVTKAAASSKL